MSALEMLSADYRIALDELTAVVDRTERPRPTRTPPSSGAQAAADEAARAEQDLATRKCDAEPAIAEA